VTGHQEQVSVLEQHDERRVHVDAIIEGGERRWPVALESLYRVVHRRCVRRSIVITQIAAS